MIDTVARKHFGLISSVVSLGILVGSLWSSMARSTRRDRTLRLAGLGALSGAALSIYMGKRRVHQILAGTVIGAGIGEGVGAFMDAREGRLGIPGPPAGMESREQPRIQG